MDHIESDIEDLLPEDMNYDAVNKAVSEDINWDEPYGDVGDDGTGDGINHINVYSRGETALGEFLSNWTYSPVTTIDGFFSSIEGYWYWLLTGDERLRKKTGWNAKSLGRDICKAQKMGEWDYDEDPTFREKITDAINQKIDDSEYRDEFYASTLPFDHYYIIKGRVVRPKNGRWIIDFLTEKRGH